MLLKNTEPMKSTLIIGASTLAITASGHAQQAIHWKASDGGNGHWYQVVVSSRISNSWSAAVRLAESQGAHLATFDSMAEWKFVKTRCTMPDAVGPET